MFRRKSRLDSDWLTRAVVVAQRKAGWGSRLYSPLYTMSAATGRLRHLSRRRLVLHSSGDMTNQTIE